MLAIPQVLVTTECPDVQDLYRSGRLAGQSVAIMLQ